MGVFSAWTRRKFMKSVAAGAGAGKTPDARAASVPRG